MEIALVDLGGEVGVRSLDVEGVGNKDDCVGVLKRVILGMGLPKWINGDEGGGVDYLG